MFKPRIFSKYLLLERLGFGGLGEVYKAKDFGKAGYQKLVAVKTIRPIYADEKEVIELFRNEAILSVSLKHENIINTFEYGKVKDQYYIVMEYIHGHDIRSILRKTKARGELFPINYILSIFCNVLHGLDYVHNQKDPFNKNMTIVHRDISPSNVLISYTGEVKLIDFGIARIESIEKKDKNVFVGKLKYASPEQVTLRNVDRRTDIFAMGIMLYELLTNENPFAGETELETVSHVKKAVYEVPSKVNPNVPRELESIILKALKKNPEERYQYAEEMRRDLIDYAEGARLSLDLKDISPYFSLLFKDQEEVVEEPAEETMILKDAADAPLAKEKTLQYIHVQDEIKQKIKKEKKSVSMLCFEVVNIIPYTCELSQDELGAIMNETFKRVIDAIYKTDGMVDILREKRMRAIFGVPKAHDNDAERAIISAFSIQKALEFFKNEINVEINYKIACDFGNIIVDFSKSDVNEVSCVGFPVDRIETILDVSPPNCITTSFDLTTFSSLEFNYTNTGTFLLDEVIYPYFKIMDRRGDERDELRGKVSSSPFTGRREHLKELNGFLNDVENREPRIISIVGDIGIGKTRLAYEFLKGVDEARARWIEIDSKPNTSKLSRDNASYSLILDLIKKVSQIKDEDSEALVRQKLYNLSRYNVGKHDVHLIGSLFSIEFPDSDIKFLEGEKLKREFYLALRRLIFNLVKERSLLLVFDDFQWADSASLDFLSYFHQSLNDEMIMMLYLHRPDISLKWEDSPFYKRINLDSLRDDETNHLAKELLKRSKLDLDFKDSIVEKSEGNPFFVEEIVKSISYQRKEGHDKDLTKHIDLYIPRTIQGILTSRIDRLDEKSKAILRCASIIGKNFREELLAHIIFSNDELKTELANSVEMSLNKLVAEGFIEILIEKKEMEFAFKHSMIHQVVYSSMVEEMQSELHRMVGESIEELFNERIDEYFELLSMHFEESKKLDKTIHYMELAADKLAKSYINDESIKYYEKIILHLSTQKIFDETHSENRIFAIKRKISNVCYRAGIWAKGIEILENLIGECEKRHDTAFAADLYKGLAKFFKAMGKWREALTHFQKAMDKAEETGAQILMLDLKREMGGIYHFMGDTENALKVIEEGYLASRFINDEHLIAKYLNDKGMVLGRLGKLSESLSCFEESLKIKERMNDKYGIGITLGNIVDVYVLDKKYDEAIKYGNEALKLTREISDSWGIALNLHNLGDIYLRTGKNKEAIDYFKKSEEISVEIGWEFGNNLNRLNILFLETMGKDRIDDGIKEMVEILDKLEKSGSIDYITVGKILIGILYFEKNDYNNARSFFREAEELANKSKISEVAERAREYIDRINGLTRTNN